MPSNHSGFIYTSLGIVLITREFLPRLDRVSIFPLILKRTHLAQCSFVISKVFRANNKLLAIDKSVFCEHSLFL